MMTAVETRARAVREKLAQAETALADLEAASAQLALEASEGAAGAEKALAGHRSKVDQAARSVSELRRAVALAEQLDDEAQADRQAAARAAQLDAFTAAADRWLGKGSELAEAIGTAARLRAEFARLTDALERALPTGVIPHVVKFHVLDTAIGGSVFPAEVDILVAGEQFRVDAGGALLPGSRPPVLAQTSDPASVEPLTAVLKRSRDYFVRLLGDRFDAMKPQKKDAA